MLRRSFLALVGLIAPLSIVAAVSPQPAKPAQSENDPVTLVTLGNWQPLAWRHMTRGEAEFELGRREGHAQKMGLVVKEHREKDLLSVTIYDETNNPCSNIRIFDGHLPNEVIIGWLSA